MKDNNPVFLLVNDDGIQAAGINTLGKVLAEIGEVVTVAPSAERSAQSQAITIANPLRIHEFGPNRYAVDGTPADCVMWALQHLLPEKPDWVISGINHGGNLGTDILYSGTVGAALEACVAGVKSIAVSLEGVSGPLHNFESAARVVQRLLKREDVLGLKEGQLLNVNVPDYPFESILGVRSARTGRRHYEGRMWERHDPRGQRYYWIGGGGQGHDPIPDSDCVLLEEGFVTISVLQPTFFHETATTDLGKRLNHAFGDRFEI